MSETPSDLRVADFDFELPQESIAQQPPAERGQSRMLVTDRASGEFRVIGEPFCDAAACDGRRFLRQRRHARARNRGSSTI